MRMQADINGMTNALTHLNVLSPSKVNMTLPILHANLFFKKSKGFSKIMYCHRH